MNQRKFKLTFLRAQQRFRTVFSLLLLLGMYSSNATQTLMGSEITYQYLDSFKYKVVLTYYRYCSDTSLTKPSHLDLICGSNLTGKSLIFLLSNPKIKDISPFTDSADLVCGNNKANAGQGVEQHRWEFILNLNDTAFQSYKNCDSLFITTYFQRKSDITTGAANAGHYNFAFINQKYAAINSSPRLQTIPKNILCCNQPHYYNIGASDTIDFDSISYHWGHPYSSVGAAIGYQNRNHLSYRHPISAYYPGSLANRNPLPVFPNGLGGNPIPVGLFLDRESGDWIMTPVVCGEKTVAVLEMKEWRKVPQIQANGDAILVMTHIGTVRRDLQYQVQNCIGNYSPTVITRFRDVICENEELCIDIGTDDRRYIDPTTGALGKLDTVTLAWNGNISNATWRIKDTTARLQEAEFCWTPKLGQAQATPYTFTVTAKDNALGITGISTRAILITVKPIAIAKTNINALTCNQYEIESELDEKFRGHPSFLWEIRDSLGKLVDYKRDAFFKKTQKNTSTRQKDTIQFKKSGRYILVHMVNSLPDNCPTIIRDTIEVFADLEMQILTQFDSFTCKGTPIRLEPHIKASHLPLTYQWGTKATLPNGLFNDTTAVMESQDTLSHFTLQLSENTYDTAVFLLLTDSNQCVIQDEIRIFQLENPKITLPNVPRLCHGEEFVATPTFDTTVFYHKYLKKNISHGSTLDKKWTTNFDPQYSSNADSLHLVKSGSYFLQISDSLGCTDIDSFTFLWNDKVIAFAGNDSTVCFNDQYAIRGSGLDTFGNQKAGFYEWWDITQTPKKLGNQTILPIKADIDKTYRLFLSVTEGGVTCTHNDTLKIKVDELPVVEIQKESEICQGSSNIPLRPFYKGAPNYSAYGFWYHSSQTSWVQNGTFINENLPPGAYYVRYNTLSPINLCVNEDSIKITITPIPQIALRKLDFCQNDALIELASGPNALKIVETPSNPNMGSQKWRCLDCNGHDFSKILLDMGVSGSPKYFLNLSSEHYTVQSNDGIDTLILEYEYIDEKGCSNKDTTAIRVINFPEIIFKESSGKVCHNEGVFSLDEISGVNLNGGKWLVLFAENYRKPQDLNHPISNYGANRFILANPQNIDPQKSNPLQNVFGQPDQFLFRYEIRMAGCIVDKDYTLTINPIPKVEITYPQLPVTFCSTSPSVRFEAKTDGTIQSWIFSDSLAVNGNIFFPRYTNFTKSKVTCIAKNKEGCFNETTGDINILRYSAIRIPDTFFMCLLPKYVVKSMVVSADVSDGFLVKWSSNAPSHVSFANIDLKSARMSVKIDNKTPNDIKIIAYEDDSWQFGCTGSEDFAVLNLVSLDKDIQISGAQEVNIFSEYTYRVSDFEAGNTYDWNVIGGDIVAQDDAEIIVRWTEMGEKEITLNYQTDKNCELYLSYPVKVGGVNSIDKNTDERVIIYPNTTSGKVFIKGKFEKWEVYSPSGQFLLASTHNNREIDLSKYSSGVYVVSVFGTVQQNFKVIVVH